MHLAIFAAVGIAARTANATTYTWNASLSSAWKTLNNWSSSPSGFPATTLDIALFSKTGTQQSIGISLSSPTNLDLGELSLTTSISPTIGNSASTMGTFTLYGSGGTLISNSSSASTLTLQNVQGSDNGQTMAVVLYSSGNINVTNAAASIAISSNIVNSSNGAHGFTKTGNGELLVSGTNSYTGATTISAGRFTVNGTHTDGGAYTISNGGTLGGGTGGTGGTIDAPITLDGGVITAGNSTTPGRLNLTGSSITVTSTPTSTFTFKIGGTTPGSGFDQIATSSADLTLNGAVLNLIDLNNYFASGQGRYAIGQTFTILTRPGKSEKASVSDFFKIGPGGQDLGQFSTFDAADTQFRINYFGGDGNDIEITTVPEPALTSMTGIGITAIISGRRKRTTPIELATA